MKTEEKYIGKYFRLKRDHSYFIPSLQEYVKFVNPDLAVRITNLFNGEPIFGSLIRIGAGAFCSDLDMHVDVELSKEGLGEEYKFNNTGLLFYMDILPPKSDKQQII